MEPLNYVGQVIKLLYVMCWRAFSKTNVRHLLCRMQDFNFVLGVHVVMKACSIW